MIEVGEYVRNKSGLIRKVTQIIPIYENGLLLSDSYIEFDRLGDVGTYKNKQAEKMFITKHSKNIIDLIEPGDYVNGYYCNYVTDLATGEKHMCNFDLNTMEWTPLEHIDIWNSIVTHEQFAQMKYRIGG